MPLRDDDRDQARELQPLRREARQGKEIDYRHVPREVLCVACAEGASPYHRPSLRWERRERAAGTRQTGGSPRCPVGTRRALVARSLEHALWAPKNSLVAHVLDASLGMRARMWRASAEDRQIELAQALGIGQKVNPDRASRS